MTLNFEGIQFPISEALLPSEENSVREFPTGGVVRPGWVDIWRQSFAPGDTVLDIGANIGVMSIAFAILGGVVHAIEGSGRHVCRLRRICAPLRAITVHPVAVSDVTAMVMGRIDDCAGEIPIQEIHFVAYDDYAREQAIPDPRFVKIDIEGMESVALLGMRHLIHNVRPRWQIEYHPSMGSFVKAKAGGFDFREFCRADYQIFDQDMQPVDEMTEDMNYFLTP